MLLRIFFLSLFLTYSSFQGLATVKTKVYRYMDNDYNDYGWGCAYRSTQTVLKYIAQLAITDFKGPIEKNLDEIRARLNLFYQKPIGEKCWLEPHDTNLYVASLTGEPGTLYLYGDVKPLHSRVLKHELQNLQKIFAYYAIEEDELMGLLNRWTRGKKIPIIIDDSICSYVLLDFDAKGEVLTIGDPHYNFPTELQKIASVSKTTTVYKVPLGKFFEKKWMILTYDL